MPQHKSPNGFCRLSMTNSCTGRGDHRRKQPRAAPFQRERCDRVLNRAPPPPSSHESVTIFSATPPQFCPAFRSFNETGTLGNTGKEKSGNGDGDFPPAPASFSPARLRSRKQRGGSAELETSLRGTRGRRRRVGWSVSTGEISPSSPFLPSHPISVVTLPATLPGAQPHHQSRCNFGGLC